MIEYKYIVEPLIGTIIGFGTNFLAVKMLFRPYKPVKIGKFTLPFTPGVIPKRKEKMAAAFGKTIGNQVFTSSDIQNLFLTDKIKNVVIDSIVNEIIKDDVSIKELVLKNVEEEKYEKIKDTIENLIVAKIISGLLNMNIGELIAKEGVVAIREKLSGSLFGNFISDSKLEGMADFAGKKIEEYIVKNGEKQIKPYIETEIQKIENETIEEIFNKYEITDEKLRMTIEKIYIKLVTDKMNNIFDSFNIADVVERKINEMDVRDVEKLFMSVMKKELNAIVNLGAVLGFLLGCINIFI